MASTNQNFAKWEGDTFVIQFTINDAETELNNYKAYWACSPITGSLVPGPIDANSPKTIVKTTSGDFSQEGGIEYLSYNKFKVGIRDSDTLGEETLDYYHELTLANSFGNNSVVVSTGTFTLNPALFPQNYR